MSRLRVLLADDNPLFAESLASLLEEDGRFDVVGRARNGAEAIALAVGLSPELILMDVEMPVVDGIEATRCITQLDGARVIVLTSSDSPAHIARARRAGATGYVRKDRLDWPELVIAALALAGPAPV